ncbi:MAG: NUDIX domain-containing protein [Oscillospiraceae bacterium]
MEQWDVFDKSGKPTGKKVIRGRLSLKKGEYHLVVHVWVLSGNGKVLIQRRSDQKPLMPGEWAATGGAAVAGENSYSAAGRELFEELGIASKREDLKLIKRFIRKNSFLDVYMIYADVSIFDLILQKEEVADVKWVTVAELKQMIKEGNFHNYGSEYFECVFSAFQKIVRKEALYNE